MEKHASTNKKIILISSITRALVIALQFVANTIIPDHEANAFKYPQQNLTQTIPDRLVKYFFGGFNRWDAQYFMHIASYGYTYENTLAFFPLYPIVVRKISNFIEPKFTFLNQESLLLLVFILFNCCMFVLAALTLHELTWRVLKDRNLAYKVTVLFCINPATVFFVAPYSECLFCLLTFKGMLHSVLIHEIPFSSRVKLKAIFYIALSTCVRSNGILNIGFLAYFTIKNYSKNRYSFFICLLAQICACSIPFILVQRLGYILFCTDFNHNLDDFLVNFAKVHELVLPGSQTLYKQSWCSKTIPLAYSYIQEHYWNVGFLKYYEIKQIPNFLLAFPIIFLMAVGTIQYIKTHFVYCLKLGFGKSQKKYLQQYEAEMFVFVVHAALLTVFCTFCIHVQVTTRMVCSATPVVYWFCAYQFRNVKENDFTLQNLFIFTKKLDRVQKCIKYYFLSYCIIGTVLFSNFLPWT